MSIYMAKTIVRILVVIYCLDFWNVSRYYLHYIYVDKNLRRTEWIIRTYHLRKLDKFDVIRNTNHYKVRIKGKVEQYSECGSVLPYTSM